MARDESVDVWNIIVEVGMLAAFFAVVRNLVIAIRTGEMFFGVEEGQFPVTLAMSPVLFSIVFTVCIVGAVMFWVAGVWPLIQRVLALFLR
jgi:hypothetical protein